MPAFLKAMRRSLDLVSTAALWTAGTGLVAMTIVVGWQVFARYVLNDTPTWAEPLTLQLMGWFILLGAAVGVRESFHLGLDIFRYLAPKPLARVMDLAGIVLTLGFGLAMAWYGAKLAAGTWDATMPVLGVPGGVDFLPLVAGGSLVALFAAERLVGLLSGGAPSAEVLAVPEVR